ncbi:hypothetical protein LMH87_001730 [Akanthomyces muscarius]|uniref:Uncharacterized protein n=1 Tax=Akanthomyces muscarius TaxID=2231603 RepID=A0A9W8UHV5_AKAMU|nr:hypothetical protein LMH87_001730 [Akanthomyces muscarius]KAJ4147190.1 hypothetical protein LMH87_001730 [Akanthomyces muscarius]
MKVGLGDPADMATVEWDDLSCMNKATHARYTWSVNLAAVTETGLLMPERRTFTLTRTRNPGIDGTKPTAATRRHWKLSEEKRGDYCAVYGAGQDRAVRHFGDA